MSSKRQQARNERTVQELVKTVPGNNTCADCFARNPGWASWSLGIFLCMRCAGLHRKLGTHISKVKSLSMDSWSNEQVEMMKRTGNAASNRIYNPTNSKPNVPMDIDEVDPAMERYIRQKYADKNLQATPIHPQRRHDTGSTESDERHSPPPLPPKASHSRFGFRSASSIFPMSSKSRRRAEASMQKAAPRSPPMVPNKESKVFGSAVGESRYGLEDLELKLETLREMGFNDDKRNMTVLKGLNGNLQRSIETLVRLGEGTKPNVPPRPAARTTTSRESTAGLSYEKSLPRQASTSQLRSNNPFDMPAPQPQSSQSTGTLPHISGSNPFGPVATQSQYDLNQSFQNLSVSNNTAAQPQTLFPHRTGGFPSQHHQHQKFLPSLETSVQAVPQQYATSATTPYSSIYGFQPQQQHSGVNQQQQQQQTPGTNQQHNNPFLQQAPAGNDDSSSNPYLHHASTFPLAAQQQPTNIFAQQHHSMPQQLQHQQSYDWSGQQQQPWGIPQSQAQPPNQYQHQPQAQNQSQYQQQPQAQNQNPYQQQLQLQQQYAQQPQYQYQPQQQLPRQTGRANNSDIMSLYNYPQLAPQVPQMPSQNVGVTHQQHGNGQSYQSNVQHSNAAPSLAGPTSNNPFVNSTENGSGQANGRARQSRESIMVEGGGWMNGRHSPDAFASLSTVQTKSMR